MKINLQQLPSTLKGRARAKMLAPDAATSLSRLETNTNGLIYLDLWHDATATLFARRLRSASYLPGYDPHGYGLAITLDGPTVLQQKLISYAGLLDMMKRYGWHCQRRDGKSNETNSFEFFFLGEASDEYVDLATPDSLSWDKPIEQKIHDRYGKEFALSPAQVQSALLKMGFFHGAIDGNNDAYLREAIMAFQRAWQLPETGNMSLPVQRTIAFVSADISMAQT